MAHTIYFVLESLILIVGLFLEWYSRHRMGLSRHFIFDQYRWDLLAEDKPIVLLAILFIIIVLIVMAILVKKRPCLSTKSKIHLGFISVMTIGLILLTIPAFRELTMSYPYFFFGLPILIIGNIIGFILSKQTC